LAVMLLKLDCLVPKQRILRQSTLQKQVSSLPHSPDLSQQSNTGK
jgi:hypothetical protein